MLISKKLSEIPQVKAVAHNRNLFQPRHSTEVYCRFLSPVPLDRPQSLVALSPGPSLVLINV